MTWVASAITSSGSCVTTSIGMPRRRRDRGEEGEDPRAERPVDRSERLVEEQERGSRRERAGDRDPLALAARELARGAIGERRRSRARATASAAIGAPLRASAPPNATFSAAVRWGKSEASCGTQPRPRVQGFEAVDPAAAERDGPADVGPRARDRLENRRLSRSARAEERRARRVPRRARGEREAGTADRRSNAASSRPPPRPQRGPGRRP